MMQIKLPIEKVLNDLELNNLILKIISISNYSKHFIANDVIYEINNQKEIEQLLTHENILKINSVGGIIINYLVYLELPFQINGNSIYDIEVPNGLSKRLIKITNGTEIIENIKKIGQWVNSDIMQHFSTDFKKIYIESRPLGQYLNSDELIIIVNELSAKIITISNFNKISTI